MVSWRTGFIALSYSHRIGKYWNVSKHQLLYNSSSPKVPCFTYFSRNVMMTFFSSPGNSSILQQSDDYTGVRHPLLSSTLQDGGADSDTNSHCALILEETTPPSISTHSGCTASTRPDKSNGNNNYEMREFNRRLLLSNGTAPGNLTAGPRNRRT